MDRSIPTGEPAWFREAYDAMVERVAELAQEGSSRGGYSDTDEGGSVNASTAENIYTTRIGRTTKVPLGNGGDESRGAPTQRQRFDGPYA